MCDNPKNVWTPDNYDEDMETFPRGLFYVPELDTEYTLPKKMEFVATTVQPAKIARAVLAGKPPNLLGSKLRAEGEWFDGMHAPILDLDMPHRIKRSSTRNHHHLLIDYPIRTQEYKKAMAAFSDVGIQQEGFSNQMKRFGETFIRWNAYKEVED